METWDALNRNIIQKQFVFLGGEFYKTFRKRSKLSLKIKNWDERYLDIYEKCVARVFLILKRLICFKAKEENRLFITTNKFQLKIFRGKEIEVRDA